MFADVVLVVVTVGCWIPLAGWLLVRLLKPAREIWHGKTAKMARWNTKRGPDVTPRSYFAFVLVMAPFLVGMILVPVGTVGRQVTGNNLWLVPGGIGLLCIFLMPVGMVLHALVNAYNRPRWLVPPSFRHQRGWVAQRRGR